MILLFKIASILAGFSLCMVAAWFFMMSMDFFHAAKTPEGAILLVLGFGALIAAFALVIMLLETIGRM